MKPTRLLLTLVALLAVAFTADLHAQTSTFTYQGFLTQNGAPANGSFDVTFTIRNDPILGSVVGGPVTNSAVNVTNGLFAVTLDLGTGPFPGGNRWIEIAVRPARAQAA